mmetsp:Transcript_50406/g.129845  ORF Transcript_50406/g.129845 Transcript_50406/m.129845 type:complete len:591 (-) Transcript_50406:153-1925(-)
MRSRKVLALLAIFALLVIATAGAKASAVVDDEDDDDEVPMKRNLERTPEAALQALRKDLKLKPSAWRRRKILAKVLAQQGEYEDALHEALVSARGAFKELEESELRLGKYVKTHLASKDDKHIHHERINICQIAESLHDVGLIAEEAAEHAEQGKARQLEDTLTSLCAYHAYEKIIMRGGCDALKICKEKYLRKLAVKTSEVFAEEKVAHMYAKKKKTQEEQLKFPCFADKKSEAFYAFGLATNRFVERLHHSRPEVQKHSVEVMKAVDRMSKVDTSIEEVLDHGFDSFLKALALTRDSRSHIVSAAYDNRILAKDRAGIDRLGAAALNEGAVLHPQQLPKALFMFPSLKKPTPFPDVHSIPSARYIEEHFPEIREEVEYVLFGADERGKIPFDALSSDVDQWGEVVTSGTWKESSLFAFGYKVKALCSALPTTCELIEEFEDIVTQVHGRVSIMRMTAHTVVQPHVGPTNARWKLHLPLFVHAKEGEEPVVTVAGESRHWHEGHVLAFDDSFEHSLRFEGEGEWIVLSMDVWPPSLSLDERKETITNDDTMAQFEKRRKNFSVGQEVKAKKEEKRRKVQEKKEKSHDEL